MSSAESLDVVMWVPIHVVDDDGVGCSQVDTQTSRLGWQQEHEAVWIGTCKIQCGAVKARPIFSKFLTTDTPLTGELWGVYCEYKFWFMFWLSN